MNEHALLALDRRLLAAHAKRDKPALVTLYAEAAAASADLDRRCFFLTHAYVFALDCGDARASELHAELKRHGRED